MISRKLDPLKITSRNYSIFLFGPRGVGKTSLLNSIQEISLRYDLLKSDLYRTLKLDPSIFRGQVETYVADHNKALVVVDEIQLIPELLNEVHWLIEKYRDKVNFILTGSSARKLKRSNVNMLGGRAIQIFMHPLTQLEISLDLQKALRYGTLPRPYLEEKDPTLFLQGYVDTYIREEIKQESLVRKIDAFIRFLDLSAQLNGENINFSKIGRQCGVASSTIEQYYSILEDTLLVHRLNGWSNSIKKQLVIGPKYYFFDNGVLNALRQELDLPLTKSSYRYGKLFEAFVICEIIRTFNYNDLRVRFNYWRTNQGTEVDLIISKSVSTPPIAIEVKSSATPDHTELTGLFSFKEDNPKAKLVCICETNQRYRRDDITFLPWQEIGDLVRMIQ